MKKTILITGGAGYIGSHTGYFVAAKGYEVIVLDKFIHDQPFNAPWARIIRGDFADEKILDFIFLNYKIDAVFHFGAFIEVGKSVTNPQAFYENNVTKTIKLLDCMLRHGVKKFIFSSSCAVYGDPVYVPIDEAHPKNPVSPYGKNKLVVEYVLEDYAHAYGLKYVSLRYFNAAGSLPELGLGEYHKDETHAIPLLLRAIYSQKPFTIFGNSYQTPDGTPIRDYVHVSDIAQAHLKALEHLDRTNVSDVFNLGTGVGSSVQELIRQAEAVCKKKAVVCIAGRRDGDSPRLVANYTKASFILGWQPQYSNLEFILKSALRFEETRRV
jgi:UDP-glucose 4-epimerase